MKKENKFRPKFITWIIADYLHLVVKCERCGQEEPIELTDTGYYFDAIGITIRHKDCVELNNVQKT